MAYIGVLLGLAFAATCQAFAPTVNFTCGAGPVYTVAVTDAVVDGIIFIDGSCGQQNVTATTETFTFDNTTCTNAVPDLGTDFYIVLQEYATINQLSDMRIKANCTANLDAQTQNLEVTADTYDPGNESSGHRHDVTSWCYIMPSFICLGLVEKMFLALSGL